VRACRHGKQCGGTMNQILTGALAMAFAVAGVFFLRFWRDTRERLFALFAVACFVMAVNRVGLALAAQQDVRGDHLYWVRLLAFALILVAVLDKNRSRKPPGS
jgi:Family of unknown function (DUF5985)